MMRHDKEKHKNIHHLFQPVLLAFSNRSCMSYEECLETEYSLYRSVCVVLEIMALMSLT